MNILLLEASAFGAQSRSARAMLGALDLLGATGSRPTVSRRNLAADPAMGLVPPGLAALVSRREHAAAGEVADARRLAELLIGELRAADLVLLATPVHNFTVPACLKAWIDHVLLPGTSLRITPSGKVGLLPPRPVIATVSSGGPLPEGGPADFITPYLARVFATLGLGPFSTHRLESMDRSDTDTDAVVRAAASAIAAELRALVQARAAGVSAPRA